MKAIMTHERSTGRLDGDSDDDQLRVMTIPNLLTTVRLIGSLSLVAIALTDRSHLFVIVFMVLVSTDWVDGKLARWLHQRSDWGARLDSLADATLFGSMLLGSLILVGDVLVDEWPWMIAAVLSYGMTTFAGIWKYGRPPAYHTWAAKMSWYAIISAVVCTFLGWSIWPLRIAMLAITLTNLEALAITWTLADWQADVPSLMRARRLRRGFAPADTVVADTVTVDD